MDSETPPLPPLLKKKKKRKKKLSETMQCQCLVYSLIMVMNAIWCVDWLVWQFDTPIVVSRGTNGKASGKHREYSIRFHAAYLVVSTRLVVDVLGGVRDATGYSFRICRTPAGRCVTPGDTRPIPQDGFIDGGQPLGFVYWQSTFFTLFHYWCRWFMIEREMRALFTECH